MSDVPEWEVYQIRHKLRSKQHECSDFCRCVKGSFDYLVAQKGFKNLDTMVDILFKDSLQYESFEKISEFLDELSVEYKRLMINKPYLKNYDQKHYDFCSKMKRFNSALAFDFMRKWSTVKNQIGEKRQHLLDKIYLYQFVENLDEFQAKLKDPYNETIVCDWNETLQVENYCGTKYAYVENYDYIVVYIEAREEMKLVERFKEIFKDVNDDLRYYTIQLISDLNIYAFAHFDCRFNYCFVDGNLVLKDLKTVPEHQPEMVIFGENVNCKLVDLY